MPPLPYVWPGRSKLSTSRWENGLKFKIPDWSELGSTSEIKRVCTETVNSLRAKLLVFKGCDWLRYKLSSSRSGEHTVQHAISKGLEIVPFWVQKRPQSKNKKKKNQQIKNKKTNKIIRNNKTNKIPFKWEMEEETNTRTTHTSLTIIKHLMNKWREIKCLVLDKGNDILHTCRTF